MRGGMDMNAGNSSTAHIIAEWEAAGSRLANEIRSLNDRKGLRKGGDVPTVEWLSVVGIRHAAASSSSAFLTNTSARLHHPSGTADRCCCLARNW